ncbi:MAG: hypothetical protein FJ308_10945 [Planctomycetes bacterium]|nr:hypothetical protein [Planctomycetota bacterium]
MTKVYRGLGLACTYPENWQLSEETAAGHADQPTVVGFNLQSPTSAFMSVYRYPRNVSPDEAIEEATKAIAADYDGIELASFEPQRELIHAGLDQSQPISSVSNTSRGTDLNFYYLDLLITVRLISFQFAQHTFLVQFQAEDRDFTAMERVFQAMLITMIQSLQSSPEQPDEQSAGEHFADDNYEFGDDYEFGNDG